MSKIPLSESQVQGAILDLLRAGGFMAWSTSRVRRPCPRCGKSFEGGDGVDKGLPDIVFCHPRIPRLMGGIEVKGTRTSVSEEQRAAAEAGCYAICRSVDEAACAVFNWWRAFAPGPDPVPNAIAQLAVDAAARAEVERWERRARSR